MKNQRILFLIWHIFENSASITNSRRKSDDPKNKKHLKKSDEQKVKMYWYPIKVIPNIEMEISKMTHKLTFKLFFSLMLFALAGSSLLFSTSSMAEARTPSKGEIVAVEDVGDVLREAVDSAIAEQLKSSRTVAHAGTLTLGMNGKTFMTQENVSLRDAGRVAEKMTDMVLGEIVESGASEGKNAEISVGDSVTVVVDNVDFGDELARKVKITITIGPVTITIEW